MLTALTNTNSSYGYLTYYHQAKILTNNEDELAIAWWIFRGAIARLGFT
ncbi:hypothetical protein [Anabaena sp. CCY 9402-a]